MARSSWFAVDVLPGVAVSVALAALVTWDPVLAGRLSQEDSLIEWLQVLLEVIGLGYVIACALRRFVPGDVFLGWMLFGIAAAEVDLDQRVFGMEILDPKFFRPHAAPFLAQVLVGAVIVAVEVALLVYAIRRRRALWAEARASVRDGWLWLLMAGAVFTLIALVWERELHHVLPLPKYFLEEAIELLGGLYLALAMRRRLQATSRRRIPQRLA